MTVAAGFREPQIRPFLASLAHHSPTASLQIYVHRHDREFEVAVQRWIANCAFHLLPPSRLRDFARKRRWARSLLKRIVRFAPGCGLGDKLPGIFNLRHIAFCDLLKTWELGAQKILLVDSRDVVFQEDPFSSAWPPLWSGEEDKRIENCGLNSWWLKRAADEAAWRQIKHHNIVCAGVIGGRADRVFQYLQRSSAKVRALARNHAFDECDQGIHNDLARRDRELDVTVLKNGNVLVANLGYTRPEDITLVDDQVRVFNRREIPAILHQYDRHPELLKFIELKWTQTMPKSPSA